MGYYDLIYMCLKDSTSINNEQLYPYDISWVSTHVGIKVGALALFNF